MRTRMRMSQRRTRIEDLDSDEDVSVDLWLVMFDRMLSWMD